MQQTNAVQTQPGVTVLADLGEVYLPGALDLGVVTLSWILNAWEWAGRKTHPVHRSTSCQCFTAPLFSQKLGQHFNPLIFLQELSRSVSADAITFDACICNSALCMLGRPQ